MAITGRVSQVWSARKVSSACDITVGSLYHSWDMNNEQVSILQCYKDYNWVYHWMKPALHQCICTQHYYRTIYLIYAMGVSTLWLFRHYNFLQCNLSCLIVQSEFSWSSEVQAAHVKRHRYNEFLSHTEQVRLVSFQRSKQAIIDYSVINMILHMTNQYILFLDIVINYIMKGNN